MRETIRNHLWGNTPLGPIEDWPFELLSSVNSMLTSKRIACLIWGESEQVLLYNDLYAPLLGSKSPTLASKPRFVTDRELLESVLSIYQGAS